MDLVPDGPEDESAVTVEASVKLTQSRSEPILGGDCVARVKLGASVDARVTVGGEVDASKRVTIGGEVFAGGSSAYDVTIDEATANAIEDGRQQAPDPYDPTTLSVGSSVTLTDEFYTGNSMSASYLALKASSGVREGRRLSLNVERVDDDVVRVTVGDSDLIENNLSLGLSAGDLSLAAGYKKSLDDGEAVQVDFDLSTQAGQDAYRDFVLGGQEPAADQDGVVESREITTLNYSTSGSLEAELGQVGVSLPFGQASDFAVVDKILADGSIRRHVSYRLNESAMQMTLDYDDWDDTTPQVSDQPVLLRNVDENYVMGYDGDPDDLDGDQDVRLDFTPAELDRLRDQATEELWRQRHMLEPDLTRAEFESELDAAADGGIESASFDIRLLLPATATDDVALLNELVHYPTPEGLLEELISLAVREADGGGGIDGVGDMSVCAG